MHPNPEANQLFSPTIWILTSCITYYLERLLLELFISGTNDQWTGFPRSNQHLRQLHTIPSFFWTCFEQAIDHQNCVQYLGAPVNLISYAWGDNESMINSATNPDARLHKRHNILSFNFVRKVIAAKLGEINVIPSILWLLKHLQLLLKKINHSASLTLKHSKFFLC